MWGIILSVIVILIMLYLLSTIFRREKRVRQHSIIPNFNFDRDVKKFDFERDVKRLNQKYRDNDNSDEKDDADKKDDADENDEDNDQFKTARLMKKNKLNFLIDF